MKTLIISVACLLLAISHVYGENYTRPEGENYIKGVEALNAGNVEEAYAHLNKEINEHPDNGYAHCYMALICNFCGDMKLAMHAVNEGLKLLPEADTEYRSFAHYTKGTLYMNAQAYDLAEKELDEAIRLAPTDVENYKTRAEIRLDKGAYDDSLADLQAAIKLDSRADVYDLMMQLLEANPDPAFFDKVTSCYQAVTANR